MNIKAYIVLTYAILILGGGLMGYAKAHSTASLVMGLSFAILLTISAYGMLKQSVLGHCCATILTGILTVFFAYRFFNTLNLFPPGILAALSFLVFIMLLINFSKNSLGT